MTKAITTPRPAPAPLLLTFKDAAQCCGITLATLRIAIQRGELKAVNAPGTHGAKGRRVPMQSIHHYIEAQLAGQGQ